MQTPLTPYPTTDGFDLVIENYPDLSDTDDAAHAIIDAFHAEGAAVQATPEMMRFYNHFVGMMAMNAPADVVAAYLGTHHEWFRRCSHPMKAELITENGYALSLGQFGSFGYVVEPKIGLDLIPPEAGIYRIQTIPVPGYTPCGYEVDFRAELELVEVPVSMDEGDALPTPLRTQVEWRLDLTVWLQFPQFIQRLPCNLIVKTGNHVLGQVVHQISRRLTHKVQEDFHRVHNLPFPKAAKR
ncbi:DUF1997 domain-containing protein [Trichothermofontia sp.]